MRKIKLVTQYDFDERWKDEFKEFSFSYLPYPGDLVGKIKYAFKINLKNYDVFLVEGVGLAFIVGIVKLLLFNRKLKIFCNIPMLSPPPKDRWKYLVRWLKIKILDMVTYHYMVISTDEIEAYNKYWGIKKEKMTFLPFKVNDKEILERLPIEDGDYIYTGGDSLRDYNTFFEAVRGLDIKVKVLSNSDFSKYEVPDNVEIVRNNGTTEEFYGPAAKSMFAVFPIEKGHIRSAGQGTYLGCMFLKKAVIVSDTPGVRDLIEDGITGIIVPAGDPEVLKKVIIELSNDHEKIKNIGSMARKVVNERYSHERYIRNIFNIIVNFYSLRIYEK